ncbi:MAG: Ni/Fe-hydrogenase, b-type cytochrome subunit [Candidatus Eisenbacteria bacterium]|nr:Ni/Fe-hydrogenase, b-type cytochrome subunit [Candidatus Eisenbacteria bacterium]
MSTIGRIHAGDVAANPSQYFRRRYVWEWPIRIFHWVNALSIAVLFSTGLYIASPFLAPAGEAWQHFVMGTVRKVHFLFAFIFAVNFLWRIVWFWMGNNYARSGFPFVWSRRWWNDLFRQVRDYLRLERGHVHIGHNALGGVVYTVFVILCGWVQIFLGFALFSEHNPEGFYGRLFGWVIPMLGGSFQVHMWHHLTAWMFLFFTIIHIYIVFYDGLQFKNGLVTSIVSGEKFYREGDIDHERWLS